MLALLLASSMSFALAGITYLRSRLNELLRPLVYASLGFLLFALSDLALPFTGVLIAKGLAGLATVSVAYGVLGAAGYGEARALLLLGLFLYAGFLASLEFLKAEALTLLFHYAVLVAFPLICGLAVQALGTREARLVGLGLVVFALAPALCPFLGRSLASWIRVAGETLLLLAFSL